MAAPESRSPGSVPTFTHRDVGPPLPGQFVPSVDADEVRVLTGLKEMIAGGGRSLDLILDRIADAAWQLTGSSGAAIAMWKDGDVVCRARAGETAPALGVRLSIESGISGACLSTGNLQQCDDTQNDPRVDAEVCRHLGLRSIVVLPIQAWREVNGILEVFSTQSSAFTGQHVALLQQLAVLAEWARSSQPHAASAVKKIVASEPQTASRLTPERVRALTEFLGNGWRPFLLGGASLLALMLVGFVIWLGWRGPSQAASNTTAVQQSPVPRATQPLGADPFANQSVDRSHLAKTSAGIPIKLASKVDRIATPKNAPAQSAQNQSAIAGSTSVGIEVRPESPGTRKVETAELEPPPVVSNSGSSSLNGVLSASSTIPALAPVAISRVTNGYPTHRVPPKYPVQALQMRLGGKVILEAVILEDGSVDGAKVLKGEPLLAQAALDAVQHWRYKPYELNGKPVKMTTTITVDFKLP